ncbi:hypothetical protein [Nannocystis sp. SCPEA4]|uniref:hypothetical protein n=1 Tax=Nannocystis sp. SCPEA4 TaxID=2996787 RepID=UPI0022701A1E|nr:hypothetical protein [Nannocystis sp. SCPEA4]MCY1062411.1 hypothetical protein [Nannocystis sp. SCPEA4]
MSSGLLAPWLVGLAVATAAPAVDAHPWALRTHAVPEASAGPQSAAPEARTGPPSDPEAPTADELEVAAVDVRLEVVRGGEHLPGGKRVPRSGGAVVGEATYTLSRPARAGETLLLLNFAEALEREPTQLDEVAIGTYLDGPFRRGRLDVREHTGAAAVSQVGSRRDVEVKLSEGTETVTLEYTVEVPRRYWPFGCSRRRCSLSGAVAPLPSVPARGGSQVGADARVVAPARWTVDARFAAVPTWSPGHVPTDSEAKVLGRDELVVATSAVGAAEVAYPEVFWGPRWKRARETHRGVQIEVLHTYWRPGDQVPEERKLQLYRDIPGHALRIAREAIDVATIVGLEPPPDSKLLVVQGPLRAEVAQAHPAAVLLSDQFLQVSPGRRFQGFHQAPAARATLDAIAYGAYVGRHDPSTDLWLYDATATALLDVWRARRAQGDEFASDILRRITFVPMVDNFLYTGQATFAQSYFRGSEDMLPLRLHPLLFSHPLPTGRRIHEKMVDLMTPAQRESFYEKMARERGADPVAAAEAAYGRSLAWFFDQWLGPYPAVDYSVEKVDSAPLPDGRWRHTITIRRAGERPAIEPVQVLATERGGQRHYLVWNGSPESGTNIEVSPGTGSIDHVFTLETQNRLRSVMVDPRARLLEEPQGRRRNVDPLYNNRSPPSFRFVYTGFGFEVSASEFLAGKTPATRFQAVSGRVLFEMSRRRDLRSIGHLQLHRDREAAAAVGGGASFWFGEKVNRRRRRGRVRLFSEVHSLTSRGLDQSAGVRFAQSLSIIDDTRKFSLWPDRGHRLSFGLYAAETIRTDVLVADHRHSLTLSGSWVHIWPLAHQHTLASRVELTMMVPLAGRPEFRSLVRAGGVDGLGAYGGNELFGRGVALAQLEYRHMFWSNFNINLVHLFWLRGIGGTLFTGVASVSSCDTLRGWFGRETWYGQVGYGVTAFLQLLGVTPQFVRFDVAVPLARRRTTCLDETLPDYLGTIQGLEPGEYQLPRIGVNLTFLQPF